MVGLVLVGLVASAHADEAKWDVDGSGGWADPSRWVGHVVPTNGMVVRLSGSTRITDADAEIVGRRFAYVTIQTVKSELVVSNESPIVIRSPIQGGGLLVKRGGGVLSLEKRENGEANLQCGRGIRIDEGVVELTAAVPLTKNYFVNCPLTVNDGGTLSLYPISGTVLTYPLYGGGVLSNSTTQAMSEAGTHVYLQGGTRDKPGVFAGHSAGRVRVHVSAHQRLTNREWANTIYEPIIGGSTTGWPSLGMVDISDYVVVRVNGEYESLATDGAAQVSTIWINNETRYFKLNAGPVGGQAFDTLYRVTGSNKAYVFELTGSNAVPASLIRDYKWSYDNSFGRFKKTGTGTWNLIGLHSTRGVTAVEQGTLNYDTLAEAGVNCSLGAAERPQEEYYGNFDATRGVDYSILLGDGETPYGSRHLAKLNYIGTEPRTITNRHVAVRGAGCLSSDVPLDWTGFRPMDAGEATIVLGGDADSVARGLSDGAGTLSVAKEGRGKWKVTGDFDISGDAFAGEGELELDASTFKLDPTNQYAYYKLTLMDNCYDWHKVGDGSVVWLAQVALIDEDNSNAALGLKYNVAADGNPTALEPGEAAFGRTGFKYLRSEFAFTNMFCDAHSSGDESVCAGSYAGRPFLDKPNTWVSFVMRPNPGFKPIVKYDLRHWAKQTNTYEQMWSREPLSWKLEGSVDGVVWDELHEVISNANPVVKGIYHWQTTDSLEYGGYPIPRSRPKELASVGAAAGALLEATGNRVKANGLVYDADRGSGVLRGFAFGEGGTIDIRKATAQTAISFKYDFEDCIGTENIGSWKVTLNGLPTERRFTYDAATGRCFLGQLGTMFKVMVDSSGPVMSEEEFFREWVADGIPRKTAGFARYVREHLDPERTTPGWDEYWADPSRFSGVKSTAEAAMAWRFRTCGTTWQYSPETMDWKFNPTYNDYAEYVWQLGRMEFLTELAKYYAVTMDPKAAEAWVAIVTSWIRQARCDDPVPTGSRGYCWRTLDAALRLEGWVSQLPLFKDEPCVTDEFIVRFMRSVCEHCRLLRAKPTSRGNWLIYELTGLVKASVAFPFFNQSPEWREWSLGMLGDQLSKQLYPDGFQYELTTGYHSVVPESYCSIVEFLRNHGETPPDFINGNLEKSFALYTYLMRPDGRTPDLNDGGRASVPYWMTKALDFFPEREDFRWLATGGAEGTMPGFTSLAMPWSGIAVMRTGWGANDIWAYMDCGPFGTGHQHEDKLSVLLWAYGKELLTEAGIYIYDTSEMRQYVLDTRSHNTAQIDGLGQNRRTGYRWKDSDLQVKAPFKFRATDDIEWARAAYDGYYGTSRELTASQDRTLIFYKRVAGLRPFFAVIDRLGAADAAEHDYEMIWHLETCGYAADGGRHFAADFGGGVTMDGFASDGAFVDKIGQKTPCLQGWMPVNQDGPHEHRPIHTPVVCGRFAEGRRVVTVFYPSDGGTCPITGLSASVDPSATTFTLTFANGTEITLDELDLPPAPAENPWP